MSHNKPHKAHYESLLAKSPKSMQVGGNQCAGGLQEKKSRVAGELKDLTCRDIKEAVVL